MKSDMVYQIVELDEYNQMNKILATYTTEKSAQAVLDVINKLSYTPSVELREQEVITDE